MFGWFGKKRGDWSDEEYQLCRDYTAHQVFQCPGFLDKPMVCEIKPDFDILSDYFRGDIGFIQDDIYAQIAYDARAGHEKIVRHLGKTLSKGLVPIPDAPVYLTLYLGDFFPMVYKIDTEKPFTGPLAESLPMATLAYLDRAYDKLKRNSDKATADRAIADLISQGVLIPTDLTPYIPVQFYDEFVTISVDVMVPDFVTKRKMKGKNQGVTEEELNSLDLPHFIDPKYFFSIREINKNLRRLNRHWRRRIVGSDAYYSAEYRGLFDDSYPKFCSEEQFCAEEKGVIDAIHQLIEMDKPERGGFGPNADLMRTLIKWFMGKNFMAFVGRDVQPRASGSINQTGYIIQKHPKLEEKKMREWLKGPHAMYEDTITKKMYDWVELVYPDFNKTRVLFQNRKHDPSLVDINHFYPAEVPVHTYSFVDMSNPGESMIRVMATCFGRIQGFKNRFVFSQEVYDKKEEFRHRQWINRPETAYNFVYTDIRTLLDHAPIIKTPENKAKILNLVHAPEVAHYREKMLATGEMPTEALDKTALPADKCPLDKDRIGTLYDATKNYSTVPSMHIPIYILEQLVPENMPMWKMYYPQQDQPNRSWYYDVENFSAQTGLQLAMKRHGLDTFKDERFRDAYFVCPPMFTGRTWGKDKDVLFYEPGRAWGKFVPIAGEIPGVGFVDWTEKAPRRYPYVWTYEEYLDKIFGGDEKALVNVVKRCMSYVEEVAIKGRALQNLVGRKRYEQKLEEEEIERQRLAVEQERQRKIQEEARRAQEIKEAAERAEKEAAEQREKARQVAQEEARKKAEEEAERLKEELGGMNISF